MSVTISSKYFHNTPFPRPFSLPSPATSSPSWCTNITTVTGIWRALSSSPCPRLRQNTGLTRGESVSSLQHFEFQNYFISFQPECFYKGFRDEEGNLTPVHWYILALKFAFVIIFEHFVFGVCKLIDVIIITFINIGQVCPKLPKK